MSFLLILWLLCSSFLGTTSADFSVYQDYSNSNTSRIRICVRLDNPPGRLFRNNIPIFSNLQDVDCVFDDNLDQSTAYTYDLEDNASNVVSNTLCTYPDPPYGLSTDILNETTAFLRHTRLTAFSPSYRVIGVQEDQRELGTFLENPNQTGRTAQILDLDLFTNYTYFVYGYHYCGIAKQSSDKTTSNTVRTGPNDLGIGITAQTASSVTISIAAQDFDWSLDYIMRRDGTIVRTFTHPEYFGGTPTQWTDTNVVAATAYTYQMEEKDHMNGLSKLSESITVCTNPPDPLRFVYNLELATLEITFTWSLPGVFHGKAIAAEITTDYLTQDTRSNLTSPFTWPTPLDPTTAYHFHMRLYIICDSPQYTNRISLTVQPIQPEITVNLLDATSVVVNFPSYDMFVDIRLFLDGSEVSPRHSTYPATVYNLIQGNSHSFHVQAKQFQESVQSPPVDITMPPRTTTIKVPVTTIFSCPTPNAPGQIHYQIINNSTISITWTATDDNWNDPGIVKTFDIINPLELSVLDIPYSTTHYEWSGELLPLTHYIFHVRSAIQCQRNGQKTYSDWVQIDAYTPPPKPVLVVLEAGTDYVVLDIHSDEIYESISLFINDFKHSPDPPSWPYRVDILEVTLSYRFSVEVSKYGQTARSADVVWSQPTTEPPVKTTLAPFVCPIPSPPVDVDYSSNGNSSIVIIWTAPTYHISDYDFVYSFDVKDSADNLEQNISESHFLWTGGFLPLTHYSFYLRSSLYCRTNGDTKHSDWTEVDAYTPPSKPALVIVERGEDYVVLDVYNSEIYDSISLFINGLKQTPDPTAWPHKLEFIVLTPVYRFYVEATKYGQKAVSNEVDWSVTTAAPTPDPKTKETGSEDSDGLSTGVTIWAIIAGIIILLLIAVLIGIFVRSKCQNRRTQDPRTVYAEYEGPSNGAYIQALNAGQIQPNNSNLNSNNQDFNKDMHRESNAYDETEIGGDKNSCQGKLSSSYHNAGLDAPRMSQQNEYWTPNNINIYEPDQ